MKYRIIKKRISPNHHHFLLCKELCLISKKLRNKAIEKINRHYAKNKTYQFTTEQAIENGFELKHNGLVYSLSVLYHLLKNEPEFRCEMNGWSVNTKALKQTLQSINEEFIGYRNALKAYYSNKNKFRGLPKPPGFKKEKQQYKMVFPKDAISCNKKKKLISLSKSGISIGMAHIFYEEKICEIEICPSRSGYVLNICLVDTREFVSVNNMSRHVLLTDTNNKSVSKRILSLDLGVNHLAMLVCNDLHSFPRDYVAMVGTGLNFLNRKTWYRTDKIRSEFIRGVKDSKKLKLHEDKHNRRMYTMLHTYSKRIVEYCLIRGITKVICGNNPGWKESVNLGKNMNRKFYGIPYHCFINMLKYKLQRHDIGFVVQEESYTSKCSFIDNEVMKHHENYLGKRVKRGLFISGKGVRINADVNGALNIMRKNLESFGSKLFEGIFHNNRNCYAVGYPRDIMPHVKLFESLTV